MNRSLTLALACCMSALLSACGSSSKGPGTTSGTAGASATTTTAGADSSAVGSSTSKSSGKSAPSGSTGLKVDTTPKFASPSSSAAVQSGVVQIAYRNIAIDPDTVRVKLGSTIKWTN